jgi:hypothetical protein
MLCLSALLSAYPNELSDLLSQTTLPALGSFEVRAIDAYVVFASAIQTSLFAMEHYHMGFPNGKIGFCLVWLWGLALGMLRFKPHLQRNTHVFCFTSTVWTYIARR